jgi:hypothetical protein
MMVCFAAAFIFCFVLRAHLIFENRRRERIASVADVLDGTANEMNLSDKTDKEMTAFRYVY